LKTGVAGSTIAYDNFLADRDAFNYDRILLGWLNESSATHLVITSPAVTSQPDPDNPSVLIDLFDLETGVEFNVQNWAAMVDPEQLRFSLWGQSTTNGVTDYVELVRQPLGHAQPGNTFRIDFLKSSFTGICVQEKHHLTATNPNTAPIVLTPSTDTWFERLLSVCTQEVNGFSLKDKTTFVDDSQITTAGGGGLFMGAGRARRINKTSSIARICRLTPLAEPVVSSCVTP